MGIIKTVMLALVGRVAGSVVPSKTWGKLLLEQELRNRQFDPRRIPDACLQELADHKLELMGYAAKLGGKNGLSERITAIEYLAKEVTDWLVPSRDPLTRAQRKFWEEGNEGDVSAILTKYGLLP
jgi:hypothetical protein